LEGCCKGCLTTAYNREGSKLDEVQGAELDDRLAYFLVMKTDLRDRHPAVWEAVKHICKQPDFARKHRFL
jgi:hypothetical protein